MLKSIPLNWNCSKDYFDMLYDMFEAMETEETTISDEKSTFPDGRPSSSSSSAGDCDYKASSAPAGAKLELGLSLAIFKALDPPIVQNLNMHFFINGFP